MRNIWSQKGFSLIGILLAAVIVCILTVTALKTYGPVMTSYQVGGTVNALGMDLTKVRVRELHMAEMSYHSFHGSYATWDQLVKDTQIPRGYSDRAQGPGKAFVPCHDIDIELIGNGFIITVTPNLEAGAPEGSPILRIDQSARLEEVQTE